MEWNGMEWNRLHGMERNEIVRSKSMLDPPKWDPGPFKISPRDSQGRSNSFSGALLAASWAAMAHLGSHWDTRRAHLDTVGPHFGASGNHLGTLAVILSSPGHSCRGSRRALWPHFFDLAVILLKIRKSCKTLVFSMVFQGFQWSERHQNPRTI